MVSYGQKKTTMGMMVMTMRTLLVLWLCTGFCVCMDEVTDVDTAEVPAEGQPADVEKGVSSDYKGDMINPSPQTDEDGEWEESIAPEDASEAWIPDQQESEAVEDQSEAPQEEEDNFSTDKPSVETEAIFVSSQKPAEPTEQAEELGDFVIRNDDDGVICLRACFAALMKIDYIGEDEETKAVNRTAEIPVPAKADVGGSCGRGPDKQAALMLEWDEGRYNLKIAFQKQNTTSKGDPNVWEARQIQFSFDTSDSYYFDAAINAGPRTVHTSPGSVFFVTPQGNSRICDAEDDITMPGANKTEIVTMQISQLKMQPYGMLNGTFGEGVDCGEDLIENPNTNVASVAVGATLACLILVVIIVYAIGRKMGAINDRSGYKSVE